MESSQKTGSMFSKRTGALFTVFLLVFVVTLGVLSALGIIPTPRAQDIAGALSSETSDTVAVVAEYPVKIAAPDIKLNQVVYSPNTADEQTLDAALLKGAVHYPGSALLGEEGNVLLFGHSSYLPTVFNQAYKTFNGIQNLKTGQIVTVSSGTYAYDYRVTSVRFAKATDENVIDLSKKSRKLTLVTCDSFKTKSDRFVVEAEYTGKRPL